MKKKFSAILVCLLLASAVSAQLSPDLRFGRLSVDKGLTHATVYCSYQDSQGFMWFGTEDGLNKFDGYSFDPYKYDPTDANSLSNNIIRVIFEDSKQNLWVGTDNGINIYQRANGSFRRYQNNPSDPSSISNNIISSIAEDASGKVWIGTSNGLNIFDHATGKFTVMKSNPSDPTTISSNVISSLAVDKAGIVWAGTASAGLNSIEAKTGKVKRYSVADGLSENDITCLYLDRDQQLWIGTVNGGVNFTSKTRNNFRNYSVATGLKSNSVFSVCQDRNGIIWIATLGGGLHALDQNGRFTVYTRDPENPESVSGDKVWHIFEDNAATLWISTSNGISFYNRTVAKFRTFKPDQSSGGNNSVFAIYEDEDGLVWTGVLGGGLNVFDRRENRFVNNRFPSLNDPSLRYNNIFAIAQDRQGTLWLGTSDGLVSYQPRSGAIKTYRHIPGQSSLSNNYVRTLLADKNGVLWIGTHGGGLNAFNIQSGTFTHYATIQGDASSLSSMVVMKVFEDSKGNLWVGTYGGGLSRLDRNTGKFTTIRSELNNPDALSSNFIHSIYEHTDGKLWIGTYGGGINVYDVQKNSFTHYTEQDGLPNNIVNGITADGSGRLWISTNNGVCRLIPKKESDPIVTTRTYTVQDGLQNKFNENAYYAGKGGWLYFGGSQGLNAFHPDSISDNTVVPPVVITRFYLFEKPARMDTLITSKRTLDLNYKQNFFSFEFAALNYLFPDKNRYAYKMDNLNEEWIYSGSRRYATYTNIDPGTYTFRVKACNNDGVWNEEGIAIQITITPPFWKTKWFIALAALFFTLLIFFYIRIRTNSLVKQNLLLEEKVNMRTHELQEKNVELTQTMDNLRSTQTQLIQAEKMASLGQLTAGIAHEIQNPLNFVNNFSELSVELLEELETEPQDQHPAIIGDLKQNLEKISYHGKRADSIVKGMLQHSRTSAAEKQSTDINKLVEEFLTLAYHGMRAKDPGFNCAMEKNLAPDLPQAKIIPQDVSRVILNIFNNAFYAVDERSKSEGKDFKPTVRITTRLIGKKIEIRVRDNGKGIPQEIRDKIFNPFFTTKPTGQGTGLGLSISYDIIVKGHEGDLQVDSKPGEFTEFIIALPV